MRRCEAQWLTVPGSMACGGRGFLWQRWKVATNDFCNIYLVYDWLLTGPCLTHSQGSDFSKQRRMIESEELKLKIHLKPTCTILESNREMYKVWCLLFVHVQSSALAASTTQARHREETGKTSHFLCTLWSLVTLHSAVVHHLWGQCVQHRWGQCAPLIRSVCITHQVCMCTGGAWSNIKYLNITILADLWERAV